MQAFRRSRGFPDWFTVTVAPKGSYREQDIIDCLKKHLEPWKNVAIGESCWQMTTPRISPIMYGLLLGLEVASFFAMVVARPLRVKHQTQISTNMCAANMVKRRLRSYRRKWSSVERSPNCHMRNVCP